MPGTGITHGSRTGSILLVFGLVVGVLSFLPSPVAAATTSVDCTADSDALQPAINAAAPGDTLNVTGTCVGNFVIDHDLTLQGTGTLNGNGSGSVVRVIPANANPWELIVTIVDLTITNGGGGDVAGVPCGGLLTGGGIINYGTLTLAGTTKVVGNTAACGGGVFTDSTLTMNDSATVTGNSSSTGGVFVGFNGTLILHGSSSVTANTGLGVIGYGGVEMNDSSKVSNNTAGGIYDRAGVVMNGSSSISNNGGSGVVVEVTRPITMNDYSSITGNTSSTGGGIFAASATVILNGHASVSGNSATASGGGIWNIGPITLNDHASVNGNTTGTMTSPGHGGGIWNAAGTTMNGHSTIQRNNAIGPGGDGGGVYLCDAYGSEGNPFATITINGGRVRKNEPNDIKFEPNCLF